MASNRKRKRDQAAVKDVAALRAGSAQAAAAAAGAGADAPPSTRARSAAAAAATAAAAAAAAAAAGAAAIDGAVGLAPAIARRARRKGSRGKNRRLDTKTAKIDRTRRRKERRISSAVGRLARASATVALDMARNDVKGDGDHDSDSDFADDGSDDDEGSASDSGDSASGSADDSGTGKDDGGAQTPKQKEKAKYADLKQRIAKLSPRRRGKPLSA